MIDTIVLSISQTDFTITDYNAFRPSAYWIANTNNFQSQKDLKAGIYKPRLTLYNAYNKDASSSVVLKIEVSLPKLVFCNNFEELRYKDFIVVITKLHIILQSMGVSTTLQALSTAKVSSIHYSKNIIFTDGSIPYHFIQKIKESCASTVLDTNQTDYRNEGHSYRWHCNAYEVVFYDKMHDLAKAKISDKRSLEKDNALQFDILEQRSQHKKLEVLRMEVRLSKRSKIKQLFSSLKLPSSLTFKKLFKPALAKKILLHYFSLIESKRPALLDQETTANKNFLCTLIVNNPTLSPQKILQVYGLKSALSTMSLREIKSLFKNTQQRSWQRMLRQLQEVCLPLKDKPFELIKHQLMSFKPCARPEPKVSYESNPDSPRKHARATRSR